MRLTDAAIRREAAPPRPRKLFDGDGLYLLLHPSGGKWWRFAYRLQGRQKVVSFGTYPDVTLATARVRRTEARQQVADGLDPSLLRRAAKRRVASTDTFAGVAAEWLAGQAKVWAASTTEKATYHLSLLTRAIGARIIASVEPPELLGILRAIEARGHSETAHKVKQRAGQIFRYAIATGRAVRDPTADLRGALQPICRTHRAALTDPADIAPLVRDLRAYHGSRVVAAALQLLPLVFVRPGELRLATWAEVTVDGPAPLWRIPAARMKEREAHLVPLSTQAVAVLLGLRQHTGPGPHAAASDTLVFPSRVGARRPISENTLNSALRRLGYGAHEMTAHGFRTLASTRLHEMGWSSAVIERQLAHADPNSVRAVYNRAAHLEERRTMMQAWADYLDRLATSPPAASYG